MENLKLKNASFSLSKPGKSASAAVQEDEAPVKSSYIMSADTHRRLRLLSADTGKKLNMLFSEAIDDLLKKYGR